MSTSFPQRCPFCDSFDLRHMAMSDLDLTCFRCRECSRLFYVPSMAFKGDPPSREDDAHGPARRAPRARRAH